MKIAVLKEKQQAEKRVAITPDAVKKYIKLGFKIFIEAGAGIESSFSDKAYEDAGATVSKILLEIVSDADIILKVQPTPLASEKENLLNEISLMKEGAIIIGLLNPFENQEIIKLYQSKKITSFAMESVPRITRAQTMDVLSSQSNLVGYKAVVDAASEFDKVFPMMMTAAGTVIPAKVLILGVGVAGLQAIATAKRLGAVVSAYDVRRETKEQAESLGANFITVSYTEEGAGSGGYAKEMSEQYKLHEQATLKKQLEKTDIVITTAQIPGRKAPILLSKEMVESLPSGSIVIDLAAASGGNCELTQKGKVIIHNDIKIIGHENYPSRLASTASKLYANNLFNFTQLIVDQKNNKITLNLEDEIIQKSMLTHNGELITKT